MCVRPHGMIHHGADPNPGFESSLFEAFPFGNLGSWCSMCITQAPVRCCRHVQHPSSHPCAQTADAFHGQKLKLGG